MPAAAQISLSGLNKAEVLAGLYNAARQIGTGYLPTRITPAQARSLLRQNDGYFEWLSGRSIKVDLAGDCFDPTRYDADNGVGAAQRVVEALRLGAVRAA